jgi:hypothetical protein
VCGRAGVSVDPHRTVGWDDQEASEQPRDGRTEDRDWNAVEDRLRSILLAGIEDMDLSAETRAKYESSATAQEVLHGVLTSPDAARHVFCLLRGIRDLPSDPTARDFRRSRP